MSWAAPTCCVQLMRVRNDRRISHPMTWHSGARFLFASATIAHCSEAGGRQRARRILA